MFENVIMPLPEYDQGMGPTDSYGLVVAFPFRAAGAAKQFWANTQIGSDTYNGKSPYPGFRLNGTGPDYQYGATGPGVADPLFGPKATYVGLVSVRNQNAGNQYFMAEGQTFLCDPNYLNAQACGYSVQFPTTIQSYDPADPLNIYKHGRAGLPGRGARPELWRTLNNGSFPGVGRGDAVSYDNWAIRGIAFRSGNGQTYAKLGFLASQNNLLIENCIFDNVQVILDNGNVNPGFEINHNNIFRRNASYGQWDEASHACGIHSRDTWLTIEDNVFYHNGWKIGVTRDEPVATGGPDIYKHCLYITNGSGTSTTVRRNMVMDGSAGGLSMRGSHVAYHNVIIDCPTPEIKSGGVNSDNDNPQGVDQLSWSNLIIGGSGITSKAPRAGGFACSGGTTASFCKFSLWINQPGRGGPNNLWLEAKSTTTDVMTYVSFEGNRAYNWCPDNKRLVRSVQSPGVLEHIFVLADVDNQLIDQSPMTTPQLYASIGFASKDDMVAQMIADPTKDWAYLLLKAASVGFNHNFSRMIGATRTFDYSLVQDLKTRVTGVTFDLGIMPDESTAIFADQASEDAMMGGLSSMSANLDAILTGAVRP